MPRINGGGVLCGIPIESPEKLKEMSESNTLVVITVASGIDEVYDQISAMGDYVIMTGRILLSDIHSTVAEELYNNQDLLKKVYQLLYDDISKKIYYEVLKRRMMYVECDFSDLIVRGDTEYRVPFMWSESRPKDEIILDCGAYEGDTLERFIYTFGPSLKKIYCFECMRDSLKKLESTVSNVKNTERYSPDILIMPYALSDYEGKTNFRETMSPTGSFVVENRLIKQNIYFKNDYEVDVDKIDNLIPEDEKVTLIKMDIEGSEYNALLGAKRVIQTHKPRLAISIYHNGKDYYRLPLLVKELVPEYKIAIRHHTRNHVDTDMYCWI